MCQASDLDQICRDENCPIIRIHAAHLPVKAVEPRDTSKSSRPPWKRPSPELLDESIVEATSLRVPKRYSELYQEIRETYGEVAANDAAALRQVHWHLERLVEAGRVLRVSIGDRFYAYLRAGSRIARDIPLIREIMSGGDYDPATSRGLGVGQRGVAHWTLGKASSL